MSTSQRKIRFSPQRDSLEKIVTAHAGHLSVEEIYKKARKKHPSISRATVYRDLQQLEEQKHLSAMQGPDNVTYYEAFSEPHHHFVCTHCRSIRNLETPNVNICTSCITKTTPILIDHIVTTLFGTCENCRG